MKLQTINRYGYTGMLFINDNTGSESGKGTLVFNKNIKFEFTGDPSTPRCVVVCDEPFPTTSVISNVRNRYGEEIMEGTEWTITSVEPMVNPFRRTEAYRHQVALRFPPNFGYNVARGT